jgi:hypothetical protein
MWEFLRWIEETEFSTWLREGDFIDPFSTYYTLLGVHSIGMAIVVGICVMLSFRLFGFHQGLSVAEANRMLTFAWWGFYINLASGVLLYVAQPRRELLTFTFWLKMISIVLAVIAMRVIQKTLDRIEVVPAPEGGGRMVELIPARLRQTAFLMNLMWFLAIVTGRLIGYTQPPPPP